MRVLDSRLMAPFSFSVDVMACIAPSLLCQKRDFRCLQPRSILVNKLSKPLCVYGGQQCDVETVSQHFFCYKDISCTDTTHPQKPPKHISTCANIQCVLPFLADINKTNGLVLFFFWLVVLFGTGKRANSMEMECGCCSNCSLPFKMDFSWTI